MMCQRAIGLRSEYEYVQKAVKPFVVNSLEGPTYVNYCRFLARDHRYIILNLNLDFHKAIGSTGVPGSLIPKTWDKLLY